MPLVAAGGCEEAYMCPHTYEEAYMCPQTYEEAYMCPHTYPVLSPRYICPSMRTHTYTDTEEVST